MSNVRLSHLTKLKGYDLQGRSTILSFTETKKPARVSVGKKVYSAHMRLGVREPTSEDAFSVSRAFLLGASNPLCAG
jgi:hypothetical protein